jgi:hypothetical protein
VQSQAEINDAVKMIENHGTKLVTSNHIQVKGEQVNREDGGLAIQYNFQFPYADLSIGINGQPTKVHMFGYKGKMLKINNFLDQLVEKEYALLLRASNNDGNVTNHIRKASKKRLIGQGLVLAVTQPPKKAMLGLKQKFPFGASNDLIKDVIIQSNKALKNISRKSHYSGLGIGLALAGIIYILYFIGPLRDILTDIVGKSGILNAIDFGLVPLGGVIAMMASKFMAASPLKKALGPLMPASQRNTFKPRNNNSPIPAFIGAGLIFLLITFIAKKFMAGDVPSWLPF